ncbi:MAG TPA: ATP-binding cassette domain-containing protein [Bacteroidia bacterium]|jgi:ABC-2 type transport system ATP-binding protein|nr:ATP-binding cassette domain-containing protein [Bacteroidia bacterium]
MNIQLTKAGKKYGRSWIFRDFSFQFNDGKKYVVIGPNGSGKSTLLKIVSGGATLSEGAIEFTSGNKKLKPEDVFQYVSIAAPWLDIPEEYTLEEIIMFHTQFKKLINNISVKEAIKIIDLEHTREKHYRNFSSGMKQRVKLGLAILSDTPLLLLDEPVTALDAKSVKWYQDMIAEYSKDKTIIVFSNNREEEFGFCEEKVLLKG